MSLGSRDHGSVEPVQLSLTCDVPKCTEQFSASEVVTGALQELALAVQLRAEAEAHGWYVARDRGARNQNWDLCPGHAPPNSMRAPVGLSAKTEKP